MCEVAFCGGLAVINEGGPGDDGVWHALVN